MTDAPAPSGRGPKAVRLAFLAVGTLFLAACAWTSWRSVRLSVIGDEAEGTVVAAPPESGPYTTISFRTLDGDEHRFWAGSTKWPLKQRVPVVYDPSYPEHADVDDFGERWLLPLVTFAGAAVCAFAVWRSGRARPAAAT